MAHNKIFSTSQVKNGVPAILEFKENLSSYMFTVVWTKDGSALSLSSLVYSFFGKFEFTQVLSNIVTDNDGELTVSLGVFTPGTKLDIIYNVFPHQNIPASAIYITNLNTGSLLKVDPASGHKALTKAKPWAAAKTITLL